MKRNKVSPSANQQTASKSRLSKAMFLAISMLTLGSGAAYAESCPTTSSLKPITALTKNKCDLKVLKNGVKTTLSDKDFANVKLVKTAQNLFDENTLQSDIFALDNWINEVLLHGDLSDPRLVANLKAFTAAYGQKTEYLKSMQAPPKVEELGHEIGILQIGLNSLLEKGLTDLADQVTFEMVLYQFNQKLSLFQFYQPLPELADLNNEIYRLQMGLDRLFVFSNVNDPLVKAQIQMASTQLNQKIRLLNIIQPPQNIPEKIQSIDAILNDILQKDSIGIIDMNNLDIKVAVEALTSERDWLSVLLDVQKPDSEHALKQDMQTINAAIDEELNSMGRVDFSDPRNAEKYYGLIAQFNLKLDALQYVRWKNGYYK